MLSTAFGVQITFILEWITFISEAAPNSLLPPVQKGNLLTSCVIFGKWLNLWETHSSHSFNGGRVHITFFDLTVIPQGQYHF